MGSGRDSIVADTGTSATPQSRGTHQQATPKRYACIRCPTVTFHTRYFKSRYGNIFRNDNSRARQRRHFLHTTDGTPLLPTTNLQARYKNPLHNFSRTRTTDFGIGHIWWDVCRARPTEAGRERTYTSSAPSQIANPNAPMPHMRATTVAPHNDNDTTSSPHTPSVSRTPARATSVALNRLR